ncbi:beta-lactamase [Trichoderma arundinaceum]|uniref:Beta-lactamase n=1 Tax=Trichoderma arundinaceum TaxID=490622 RepID=A0A395NIN1_TRIAR|nr:beta-lactamase [Trichoderma arundinaceum]
MSTIFSQLEDLIRSGHEGNTGVASILAKLGTPCASVAIMEDGVISSHCFSTGKDDTETIFQACSISKATFTVALMKLVDEGKIKLDGRIGDLLPQDVLNILTNGASPAKVSAIKSITVAQLLSHTSGLSQGGFPGYSILDNSRIPTPREVLTGGYPVNTKDVHMQGFPGQSFSYSGGGFTVLQVIVETITDKDLPSAMQEILLGPLGMTRSFFHQLPSGEENRARAHYNGYTPCEDAQRVNPEQAAAGLWTTPSDLLKLVRAVQQSLQRSDDTGFLRQDTAKTMLTVVDMDVAHSWFIPGDSRNVFSHGGSNWPGFRTYVAGYANLPGAKETVIPKNCGISIMTNSAEGDTVMWKLLQAIPYLKDWPEIPFPLGYANVVPFELPREEIAAKWKHWIGNWTCGRKDWIVQADEAGHPTIQYDQLPPFPLVAAAMAGVKSDSKPETLNLIVNGLEVLVQFCNDGTIGILNGRGEKATKLVRV